MLPLRRAAIKRRGHHHLRLVFCLRPSRATMVLPHQTPYVTPHILHKHYAQAHDNEQYSKCAP